MRARWRTRSGVPEQRGRETWGREAEYRPGHSCRGQDLGPAYVIARHVANHDQAVARELALIRWYGVYRRLTSWLESARICRAECSVARMTGLALNTALVGRERRCFHAMPPVFPSEARAGARKSEAEPAIPHLAAAVKTTVIRCALKPPPQVPPTRRLGRSSDSMEAVKAMGSSRRASRGGSTGGPSRRFARDSLALKSRRPPRKGVVDG
jgi:hypothetical protein